ncbi:bifunctional diguanylate cyclase/phosphodiesterase [Massilia sp. KIM]|uniref:putative bifunctional diguanylate cyclase/phosphodiesterase n=1 Tax=Massilia sp. KIM TaxID=1955422 RepID=UPI00098F3AF2|nr:EAL domain-containing protein [Massilia sp. KIM]
MEHGPWRPAAASPQHGDAHSPDAASCAPPGASFSPPAQPTVGYNELFLLAPFGFFLVGVDGLILQANLCAARLLGATRAALTGKALSELALAPKECAAFLAEVAANAGEVHRRMTLRMEDGGELPMRLLGSFDVGSRACRVVAEPAGGAFDALLRSEERLRRIVHCADEGVWEVDAHGNTSFVNPRMAALLGYAIEDILGQPVSRFMDEEGKALLERNIVRRRQGEVRRYEFKFVRSDGKELWTCVALNPLFDASGRYMGALALVDDVTARRAAAARIWHQANYDDLTGLPNRHMFMDRLAQEVRRADRSAALLALLFIDLDHFKEVNDRLGHAAGDRLLADAAQRIGACVRATDTIGRLGGDEFTVVLSSLDRIETVDRIAQALVDKLAAPFELAGTRAEVSASIGIALYPADATQVCDLMARADQAMYEAKNDGRNRYGYYTDGAQQALFARQALAAELREALDGGQLELLYQPIAALGDGKIRKAEAFLRWRHPRRGLLRPAEFLPFAEPGSLMVEIGDWVLRQAAVQVERWQRCCDPHFQVCVNKTPTQSRREPGQYDAWLDFLRGRELPPRSVVVEIGEGMLLEGMDAVIERLRPQRALGLQVALDRFSGGYSSMSHLVRYELDYVKIDHCFVDALDREANGLAVCEAIIAMAHKLGMQVVAEGVDTEVQRALLREVGCDFAQGHAVGGPMTAGDLERAAGARA